MMNAVLVAIQDLKGSMVGRFLACSRRPVHLYTSRRKRIHQHRTRN